jgi:hypothetical protein
LDSYSQNTWQVFKNEGFASMLDENPSSYVYVFHICFRHMTSMCKKIQTYEEQISCTIFKFSNWGMQVCDEFCIISHKSPII